MMTMSATAFAGMLFAMSLGAGTSEPQTSEPQTSEPERISFEEEILVTATARESEELDLPYSTYILTGDDLRRRQMARTVPEALAEVPGVMVQATSQGQGSPYLRGFTGFRTLFLIDGIRLNNSVFREGPNQYWTTVDPFGLEQLEVVQGPGSVLHGSDAVGGTVQGLTLAPGAPLAEEDLAGTLLYRYASAEHSQGGHLTVRGRVGERWSLALRGGAKSFGDVRAGDPTGTQPRTGYGEWDGDLKAVRETAGGGRLILAHQRVEIDDAWRTHSTDAARSFRETSIGSDRERSRDQRRALSYVQYHGSGGFSASLSYHEQSEDEFRIRRNGARELQGFDVGTLGLWARWTAASRRAGAWSLGIESYRDEVDSSAVQLDDSGAVLRREVQGPVGDDARYDLWGVYVQNEARWSPRLSTVLGARWTGARASADRVRDPASGRTIRVEGDWHKAVGNARILLRLGGSETWRLFGGLSQGFRAPNLSDLTRFDSARSNEREVAAPDLQPEDFLSYELGVKLRRPRLGFEAALFHTAIDGLIVRVPTGRTLGTEVEVTKRNAGDGFVHGVELRGEAGLGAGWRLAGSWAWLEGEVEIAEPGAGLRRQTLDKMTPATGRLSLRWQPPARPWEAQILWEAAAEQDRLSPGDRADTQRIPPGGTPGWEVLTLRGSWSLTDRLSLSGAAENLLDEDYRIHGSGLNRPGRNLVLGLEIGF